MSTYGGSSARRKPRQLAAGRTALGYFDLSTALWVLYPFLVAAIQFSGSSGLGASAVGGKILLPQGNARESEASGL